MGQDQGIDLCIAAARIDKCDCLHVFISLRSEGSSACLILARRCITRCYSAGFLNVSVNAVDVPACLMYRLYRPLKLHFEKSVCQINGGERVCGTGTAGGDRHQANGD